MTEEQTLLRSYREKRCEESFRAIVDTFGPMVHATAYRRVSSKPHLVDDIVQKVFVDLATEAFRMSPEIKLAGWLHRHTCFVSSNSLRTERRRVGRERKASEIHNDESDEPPWAHLEPELDSAIDELSAVDREAILLRFFQKLSLQRVGEALGVSDDAAQKRITRAIDRLRKSFSHRGIAVSTLALTAGLNSQLAIAAPIFTSATIAAHALTASTASSLGSTLAGSATLTTTIMTKTSLITSLVAAVTIGAGSTYLFNASQLQEKEQEIQQLQSQLAESENTATPPVQIPDRLNESDQRDLLRLRAEVARLRKVTNDLQLASAPISPQLERPKTSAEVPDETTPNETEEDNDYLPRESWAYQGFADPDSAFKSSIWAMNEGDMSKVSQAWTDAYLVSRSEEFVDKTDEEIASTLKRDVAMADGIRVIGQEQVSSSEMIVKVEVESTEDVPPWVKARMKKVGAEWRFDGWAETAQQNNR